MGRDLSGTEKQKELRDSIQEAMFLAALLIKSKTYAKFVEMMNQFGKFLGEKEKNKKLEEKVNFLAKQKTFVNALRKDYRSLSKIDFETWDFHLPKKVAS